MANDWESYYDVRPNVLELPQDKSSQQRLFFDNIREQSWKNLRWGFLSVNSILLAAYPQDTHFYFLARDAELLYDLMKLMTQGTEAESRVHLLNVSRSSVGSKDLKDYLADHGLTDENLIRGRKAVIVDTGLVGSIPSHIRSLFPKHLRPQIKGHLLVSETPQNYPSSLSFLVHQSRSSPAVAPQNMGIWHFETVTPKFVERATRYEKINGLWHPMSPTVNRGVEDGVVDKVFALKQMQNLKAFWFKKKTKRYAKALSQQLRWLISVLTSSDTAQLQILRERINTRGQSPSGRLLEAQVRDLLASTYNTGLKINIQLSDLGLAPQIEDRKQAEKEFALDRERTLRPHWKALFDNTDEVIKTWIAEERWTLLRRVIIAYRDITWHELYNAFKNHLMSELSSSPAKTDLQLFYLKTKMAGDSIDLIDAILRLSDEPLEKYRSFLIAAYSKKTQSHFAIIRLLSSANPSNKVDLIRQSLGVLSPYSLRDLKNFKQWTFFLAQPENIILAQAAEISDPKEREKYLKEHYVYQDFYSENENLKSSMLRCSSLFTK